MRKFKFTILSLLVVVVLMYFFPSEQDTFSNLYQKEDNLSKGLLQLQNKPLKSITVDGVNWNYYSGGNGDKCIVFIHGMGGTYDFWWHQIAYFEPQYRIISYTLPEEINSLEKVDKGIMAILQQEKIDKFIPIGTSMGGYITQYLMHQHPERIEKAVLSNTFPPNEIIASSSAGKRKIIPLLPEYVVSILAKKQLKTDIFPTSENDEFLKALLLSVPVSKKGLIGRFDIVTDYFSAEPKKIAIAVIPKLILEADNDPMITPQLRQQLKELYPEAQVFTFRNKGHFPYINDREEYNKVVKAFLDL